MAATDTVFKAIAHPARREIMALLSVANRSVSEITAEFQMSQPAISQHLRQLRNARLVASERVGLEQRYRLTGAPLKAVLDWSSTHPAPHGNSRKRAGKRDAGMAVEGSVPAAGVIVPHLVVRDAAEALAFLRKRVFGSCALSLSLTKWGGGTHSHQGLVIAGTDFNRRTSPATGTRGRVATGVA